MKMYRFLFLILLISVLVVPLHVFAYAPAVVDEADCLSEAEEERLTERINKLRDTYEMDVAIVIEDEMSRSSAEAAADDWYDYNGYGIGTNDDGILFYVSVDSRKYHFSTYAEGENAFNENGIAYLKRSVEPYLKEDDFSGACFEYVARAEEMLPMWADGHPYNEKPPKKLFIPVLIVIFLPIIVAGGWMMIRLAKMDTVNKQMMANNYIKPGGMNVSNSKDIFLYSHITRTEKPKETSSNGRHISSSGRTHGGGGGSF